MSRRRGISIPRQEESCAGFYRRIDRPTESDGSRKPSYGGRLKRLRYVFSASRFV